MSSLDLLTGFIKIKNEHTKFTTKEKFSQTLHKNEISTRTRFWQRTYNFHSFMLTFSTQKKLISDVKVVSAISSDFYCQEIMRFLYIWSNFREGNITCQKQNRTSQKFFFASWLIYRTATAAAARILKFMVADVISVYVIILHSFLIFSLHLFPSHIRSFSS